MKKLILIPILASLSFPILAQQQGFTGPGSQQQSQGGFSGSEVRQTVAHAKTLADDSNVILEGNITKKIGHEHYEFMDNTGSIVVEIDDDKWMGQTVSPNNIVRLEGEVDKDRSKTDIDVKRITVLK